MKNLIEFNDAVDLISIASTNIPTCFSVNFNKFLTWINGAAGSEEQRKLAKKVKYLFIAEICTWMNNNDESIKYYAKLIDMHPNDDWYAFAYVNLANSLIFAQKYDKALETLKEVELLIEKSTDNSHISIKYLIEFNKTLIFIKNKDIENAYLCISQMKNMDKHRNADYVKYEYLLSCLYFCLNDIDNGFKWYYKQVEIDNKPCFKIINDRWCNNARKDKRFVDILKEMKLYDYWKDSL